MTDSNDDDDRDFLDELDGEQVLALPAEVIYFLREVGPFLDGGPGKAQRWADQIEALLVRHHDLLIQQNRR